MCSYNAEKYIERAIKSIIDQTYKDWELVISDDASTDNTIKLIEKYCADPRIKLYRHFENIGYVKNKNRAFRYASGELLTELDADDTCPPERIERQIQVFKNPNIQICGTNYCTIDVDDKLLAFRKYDYDRLIDKISNDYPFWFPSLMFRKEVLNEFGYFNEYFSGIYGDDEYWTYRVNSKYLVYFIKDVLYNYRISPTSLTNVLDNPRKLIAWEILEELYRQRNETGTDALEKGDLALMAEFESKLLSDKKFLSGKYRMWAAKAIDNRDWMRARKYLSKSISLYWANPLIYRTIIYYLRHRYIK